MAYQAVPVCAPPWYSEKVNATSKLMHSLSVTLMVKATSKSIHCDSGLMNLKTRKKGMAKMKHSLTTMKNMKVRLKVMH